MAPITHQTIKLSRGKHSSAMDGACVMELASMLAGEPFSDHPVAACPVIGSFLRAYNDLVDDTRRQDLYRYASKVVGSRAPDEVQRARAERLVSWALELRTSRWSRLFRGRRLHALIAEPHVDAFGTHVVKSIPTISDAAHRHVLRLLDELLTLSDVEQPPPAELPPERCAGTVAAVG